jgi:hypothetical protein
MHVAENMEAIRLPVARPLVEMLIETQVKVPTRNAITALSQQEISSNSSFIAFVALVLGGIAAVPDLYKAAEWLWTHAGDTVCWMWARACLTRHP